MKKYTVKEINGDYAKLLGEDGDVFEITVFLLPENLTVGEVIACENFCWFRPQS